MSDEHVELDNDSRSLLAELWETPVGRRSVLKAGLGSAVALGVGSMGAPVAQAVPKKRKRHRFESTDLHFALGHVRRVTRLTLVMNGQRLVLKRHTKASREALRRRGGLWGFADLSKLSHHVSGVRMPSDRSLLVSVHGKRGRREVLVAHLWHVPRAATIAHARASHRATRSYKHDAGSARRLARLGVRPAQIRSAQHVAQLATIGDSYTTAVALTKLHPNIATINPTNSATTIALLGQTTAVTALGRYIATMQSAGRNVATSVAAKNPDGTLAQLKVPIVQDGKVVGYDTTGFSSLLLNQTDSKFVGALRAGVSAGITHVRNTASLGAVINEPLDQDRAASTQTWVQSQGLTPQAQPFRQALKAGSGINIQVKNPGVAFGTETVVNGGYANGQVPLKLYNNWVRWVWVYVQYLGKDNENLSANPNASFPDTKYAQSLGLLPQVLTVLGVPLSHTNTIDVTLNFPEGAHTARILLCGLGSTLVDGGWRQYFPTDAYPDAIAPSDEVLVPGLLTGVLTIGVTAMALVTELDIAATWALVDGEIKAFSRTLSIYLSEILRSAGIGLTAAEGVAAGVAAGAATYSDIAANGGSTSNIWNTLLGLAGVIPKVLFNYAASDFWGRVAADIIGGEIGFKISEAIPYIGELIGVIVAVGDAAALAQECAETIVSPWVIENEVTLTYPATITINRSADPPDSTFPATARSWRLEAKVDGAVVLAPITGSVNPGGVLQTGPLTVPVTAPFGGQTIQWTVVFSTADGVQVGAGVSAQLTNNDPDNPPSDVSITITEIPPEIDASTVFKRTVTTGYSAVTGGYTWSNQITDAETVLSNGVQQVMGTTVSTLSGVAGMVWEQNNKFYLRGVPIAQNGATLSLGQATNEGYTRRPFLLFDAFVERTSQGNHVLLEPDPSTPAYHVRKVSLDPTTGSPTWDPTRSYGTFLLPVSAAALHSSGRVVVVHTDSGRLGSLLPIPTPLPLVASYTAGAGTAIGLLSSPIAIAVTNPGTVLVLEAANSQVSAFDLNGNPVPYFPTSLTRRALLSRNGTGPARRLRSGQGQYTLPLVSTGTYLDLGVDGAGQMYVLYYTGDGSAVGDYHVDVYTAAGVVIDTHSAGVNVPHFAVDYFRSIFAANYDPLADIATGKPHIDPALGVIEPSMSRFDPTEVTTLRGPKPRKPKHRHKHRHKHKPKPHHKPTPHHKG